ncbi:MAG: aldo/keto reductase [Micromonosporaceae bacterium]
MEHVSLGASGLRVSRLGYGCMGLSSHPRDDEAARAVLRHALELGVTFFDTASRYGGGHNERLLGQVLAASADDIVLATKLGAGSDSARGRKVNGRPKAVRTACEASLRRLRVEVIDLYYLCRTDAAVPIEETIGAMADLVAAGKVRAVGLTEAAPETIRRAHSVHPVAALQAELSLCARNAESGPLQVCRELGITFVAYRPLGVGWLAGSADPGRSEPGCAHLTGHQGLQLVTQLRELATLLDCTPGQLALAWVLARGTDVVPIPGTRRLGHLEENVAATHSEPGPVQLRALDTVFAHSRRDEGAAHELLETPELRPETRQHSGTARQRRERTPG